MKKEVSISYDTLPTSKFQDDSLNIEKGTASYYDYNKPRYTANGSKFNPRALTCAYYRNSNNKREFLNKNVKVCANDTCIILKVTDNGAFRDSRYKHLNRKIDLTPYAMTLLGGSRKQGVINVTVYY